MQQKNAWINGSRRHRERKEREIYRWAYNTARHSAATEWSGRCEGLSLLSISLREVVPRGPGPGRYALHPWTRNTVSFARTGRRPLHGTTSLLSRRKSETWPDKESWSRYYDIYTQQQVIKGHLHVTTVNIFYDQSHATVIDPLLVQFAANCRLTFI